MIIRLIRRPATWAALAAIVVAAGFGLYWFQPWKLVVDERVDDALSSPAPAAGVGDRSPAAPATAAPPEPAGPVLVSEAEFISHEHTTTGTARIVRDPDGNHQLEFVELDTSNGPDLRVWLTDQPVIEGEAGWHVFDDGAWVELGPLKGNQGNQVYEIPADVDIDSYTSVSIWCKRFAVSFGAASLG